MIWVSMPWGNFHVVYGQCATPGCKTHHYLGGIDENNWPLVRYDTHREAFEVAYKANLQPT